MSVEVKAPQDAIDAIPQERITGDILRGRGPRRGNLEALLKYWRPIMRKPGGFRRCLVILADHPELYPLEPLCAWLHHETTGKWPNEKGFGHSHSPRRKMVSRTVLVERQTNRKAASVETYEPSRWAERYDDFKRGSVAYEPIAGRSTLIDYKASRWLIGAASTLLPGEAHPFRISPTRRIAYSLLFPGSSLPNIGPRIGGGGTGGTRNPFRCPPGFENGGRFTNRNLSTCGQQLFGLPGAEVDNQVRQTVRSQVRQGANGGSGGGNGARTSTNLQIRRVADARLRQLRAGVPEKVKRSNSSARSRSASKVLSSMKKLKGDEGNNVRRLVRRDGSVVSVLAPISKIAKQRDNDDLDGSIYIRRITDLGRASGIDDLPLFRTGVSELRYSLPGGATATLSTSRKPNAREVNSLTRRASNLAKGGNEFDYFGAMAELADSSKILSFDVEAPGVKDRNERITVRNEKGVTRNVKRWVFNLFLAKNAPERPRGRAPFVIVDGDGKEKSLHDVERRFLSVDTKVLNNYRPRMPRGMGEPLGPLAYSVTPIPRASDYSDYFNSVDYKAASWKADKDYASFNYEFKRAVWDPKVNRYRCPPGTRYGGRITNRVGAGCGGSIIRRAIGAVRRGINAVDDNLAGREARRMARIEARAGRKKPIRARLADAADRAADKIDVNDPAATVKKWKPGKKDSNAVSAFAAKLDALADWIDVDGDSNPPDIDIPEPEKHKGDKDKASLFKKIAATLDGLADKIDPDNDESRTREVTEAVDEVEDVADAATPEDAPEPDAPSPDLPDVKGTDRGPIYKSLSDDETGVAIEAISSITAATNSEWKKRLGVEPTQEAIDSYVAERMDHPSAPYRNKLLRLRSDWMLFGNLTEDDIDEGIDNLRYATPRTRSIVKDEIKKFRAESDAAKSAKAVEDDLLKVMESQASTVTSFDNVQETMLEYNQSFGEQMAALKRGDDYYVGAYATVKKWRDWGLGEIIYPQQPQQFIDPDTGSVFEESPDTIKAFPWVDNTETLDPLDEFFGDLHGQLLGWPEKNPSKNSSYGAMVVNSKGQVLLRRTAGDFDGYRWTIAKGGLDGDETPAQAAIREVREETGHEIELIDWLPDAYPTPNSDTYLFVARSAGFNESSIGPETDEVKWVDLDEARELIGETTNAAGRQRDLAIVDALEKSLNNGNEADIKAEQALPQPSLPGKYADDGHLAVGMYAAVNGMPESGEKTRFINKLGKAENWLDEFPTGQAAQNATQGDIDLFNEITDELYLANKKGQDLDEFARGYGFDDLSDLLDSYETTQARRVAASRRVVQEIWDNPNMKSVVDAEFEEDDYGSHLNKVNELEAKTIEADEAMNEALQDRNWPAYHQAYIDKASFEAQAKVHKEAYDAKKAAFETKVDEEVEEVEEAVQQVAPSEVFAPEGKLVDLNGNTVDELPQSPDLNDPTPNFNKSQQTTYAFTQFDNMVSRTDGNDPQGEINKYFERTKERVDKLRADWENATPEGREALLANQEWRKQFIRAQALEFAKKRHFAKVEGREKGETFNDGEFDLTEFDGRIGRLSGEVSDLDDDIQKLRGRATSTDSAEVANAAIASMQEKEILRARKRAELEVLQERKNTELADFIAGEEAYKKAVANKNVVRVKSPLLHLNKPTKDGNLSHQEVKPGNKGMSTQSDADSYVADGGDLSEVPNDFLRSAIIENSGSGKRFTELGGHDPGINASGGENHKTRIFLDSKTGRKYVLKRPLRDDGEHLSEQLSQEIMQMVGLPSYSPKIGGELYSAKGKGGATTQNRSMVMEHVENLVDGDASVGYSSQINLDSLARINVLDALMNEYDRHGQNVLTVVTPSGAKILVPIDHGKAFQEWDTDLYGPDPGLAVKHLQSVIAGSIKDIDDKRTFVRALRREIKDFDVDELRERASRIAQERGYGAEETAKLMARVDFVEQRRQSFLDGGLDEYVDSLPGGDLPKQFEVQGNKSLKSATQGNTSKPEDSYGAVFGVFDGGDVEDFAVRSMPILHQKFTESGKSTKTPATEYRFKLREDARKRIIAELQDPDSGWERKSGFAVPLQQPDGSIVDRADGQFADGSKMKAKYSTGSGATFRRELEDGTVIYVINGGSGYTQNSFSGTVRVIVPDGVEGDPSDRFAEVSKDVIGIKNVGVPDEDQVEQFAVAKLLSSMFPQWRDGQDRAGLLDNLKQNYGITVDDLELDYAPNGYPVVKLNERATADFIKKHDLASISQNINYAGNGDAKERVISIIQSGYLLPITERYTTNVGKTGGSTTSDIGNDAADWSYMLKPTGSTAKATYQSVVNGGYPGQWQIMFPPELVGRVGWIAGTGDIWGKKASQAAPSAAFNGNAYEIDFKGGISIADAVGLGVPTLQVKQEIIQTLNQSGIYEVNGVPLEDFLRTP